MPDLSPSERKLKNRRQFIQWSLWTGLMTAAALKFNPGKAQATDAVKIPPIPKSDYSLGLSFDPMMVLRDFDYGTVKEEDGRTVRNLNSMLTAPPLS
jgi:manganese oxidase